MLDLYTLVYRSHATALMTEDELPRLIDTAQRNNAQAEITGLLTYGGGLFVQWLEGPAHQVLDLWDRLHRDPRHECLLQLQAWRGVHERLYPDWHMEPVPAGQVREVLREAAARTRSALHRQAIELIGRFLDVGAPGERLGA